MEEVQLKPAGRDRATSRSRSGSRSAMSKSSPRSRSRSPRRSRSRSSRSRSRGRERNWDRDSKRDNKKEGPADEKLAMYVRNLLEEKKDLDPMKFPFVHKLITNEIDNITKTASGIVPEEGFVDLYNDTPISLTVRALPPVKVFPKFNYAGRIIGPRGAYLKALMKETMCKMVLLGKGVLKDKEKEKDLKDSGDPKYFHLHEDMHVSITVDAPPSEAYARIAYALSCLRKQVLNDNRTLESLPWIAHAIRMLEGGGRMMSRNPSPPPLHRPSRPPPPDLDYPPPFHNPHHRSDYSYSRSYFERSPPHKPYAREESPPSRAMEYAFGTSRSYSSHNSRRSPSEPGPHSRGYDYPRSNGPPLDVPLSYGGARESWEEPSAGWRSKPWSPKPAASSSRYFTK